MKAAARLTMSKRGWSAFSLLIWLLSLLPVGLHTVPARAQGAVVLVGSGSSVPAPLYNRRTQEYSKRASNIQMRYLALAPPKGSSRYLTARVTLAPGKRSLQRRSEKRAA